MYKIIQAPDPVLTAKAKRVKKIDESIKTLVAEMVKTLEAATDPEGVGLAAPQIGKSLQIFVVKESPKSPVLTVINPVIKERIDKPKPKKTKKKKDEDVRLEGCLSLSDIWGVVVRHEKVRMSYIDLDGKEQETLFEGFLATIMQHEFDHLQGVLFPKRVLEQSGILYKAKRDSKGEMVFEEITI